MWEILFLTIMKRMFTIYFQSELSALRHRLSKNSKLSDRAAMRAKLLKKGGLDELKKKLDTYKKTEDKLEKIEKKKEEKQKERYVNLNVFNFSLTFGNVVVYCLMHYYTAVICHILLAVTQFAAHCDTDSDVDFKVFTEKCFMWCSDN